MKKKFVRKTIQPSDSPNAHFIFGLLLTIVRNSNMTGLSTNHCDSKSGSKVLTRRERLKSVLYLRLKVRKVLKIVKGGHFSTLDFLKTQSVAKYQKS